MFYVRLREHQKNTTRRTPSKPLIFMFVIFRIFLFSIVILVFCFYEKGVLAFKFGGVLGVILVQIVLHLSSQLFPYYIHIGDNI
jgi:hypothetical protein